MSTQQTKRTRIHPFSASNLKKSGFSAWRINSEGTGIEEYPEKSRCKLGCDCHEVSEEDGDQLLKVLRKKEWGWIIIPCTAGESN